MENQSQSLAPVKETQIPVVHTPTIDPSTTSYNSSLEAEVFNLRTMLVGIVLFAVGLTLLSLGYLAELGPSLGSLFSALGSTLLVSGVLSWASEAAIRRSFLAVTHRAVSAAIQESGPMSLRAVIQESMPQRYAHIKQAGIVDAYQSLEIDKLKESIDRTSNSEIKICKMWIPSLHRLEQSLLRAIEFGNCTVRIVLLDPSAQEVLVKRADALGRYHRADDAARRIRENIEVIRSIHERLEGRGLSKERLQLRLFNGFFGVSLHGYGDILVVGLYLHGRLATEGMQIKVSGSTHPFFQELRTHFDEVWDASREYDLQTAVDDTHALPPASSSASDEVEKPSP